MIFLPTASSVARISCTNDHICFIGWDRVSLTFYLGWPSTMILPISASRGVGTKGVHHFFGPICSLLVFFLSTTHWS
jgi:hypothetical protein